MEPRKCSALLRAAFAAALLLPPAMAQPQAPALPAFEVASVKMNTAQMPSDTRPRRSGTLVTMTNTQVGSFIFYAYNLNARYEVEGIPDWPDHSRWFDLEARTTPDATEDQVRQMFQTLLAERFNMKSHRETRQMDRYVLTAGKGKLKLEPAVADKPMQVTIEDRTFSHPAGACSVTLWREGRHMLCTAVTMDRIAAEVRRALNSPVENRTGLSGLFNLDLLYDEPRPDAPPDSVLAPTFTAALSAAGLKVEKSKGPVEVLVIDRIELPTQN